ncbi:hypothetical protein ACH5RR_029067 [Cinchona calisaya]|uniref:Uncharacterized protein n=1 Tax=Cinchona calisaya TaxID=153742 RepID=A0ABD2YST4_9GENT
MNELICWLRVGWDKFVSHYHVCLGYVVLFKYRHNFVFDVCIFDAPGTEIDFGSSNMGCSRVNEVIILQSSKEAIIISSSSEEIEEKVCARQLRKKAAGTTPGKNGGLNYGSGVDTKRLMKIMSAVKAKKHEAYVRSMFDSQYPFLFL